jgi:hypothetical protein
MDEIFVTVTTPTWKTKFKLAFPWAGIAAEATRVDKKTIQAHQLGPYLYISCWSQGELLFLCEQFSRYGNSLSLSNFSLPGLIKAATLWKSKGGSISPLQQVVIKRFEEISG